MKRVLLFLAVSAAASLFGLLPWHSRDAAALLPVETLLIDVSAGQVQLSAVDGLTGAGEDLAQAMDAMANAAPGELFFGQVSRVVVGSGAASVLTTAATESLLRLNTAVYRVRGRAAVLTDGLKELEPLCRAQERRGTLTTLLQLCADGAVPVELSRGKEAGGA